MQVRSLLMRTAISEAEDESFERILFPISLYFSKTELGRAQDTSARRRGEGVASGATNRYYGLGELF